ncbi:hypothetical protein [Bradyrhizobium elkanii]
MPGKSNAPYFDVVRQCVENINFYKQNGMSIEDAAVLITTPKGWKAPPKFPRGEIFQVKPDGTRIRRLPALRLIAWFVGAGIVKAIYEDRNDFAVDTNDGTTPLPPSDPHSGPEHPVQRDGAEPGSDPQPGRS